ncbi:MAG TPA: sensor histidine kinase KdpD [Candidatus Acidoferrales bacterium]|jgi:two-component system sensor histidine kinase KdpD|nr:sensor histidine kinase KdpD [Candidatus Acidoferrales bacterium]
MSDTRPNPDALLAAIQSESARKQRGRLKVFLGMCPGVGKTYAMLEAAQRELKGGRDLVVGYVETHGRTETDALVEGLPVIARKNLEHRNLALTEMDLDAVLARHPQLALVDELAHTNAPGSRHPKRWQDVNELLDAGIDVFTTLNVQHLESRADTVRQITGAEIRETVPDSILDAAALELVDLPPTDLIGRLQQGKVYVPERATSAAQNFFREANLTALRELSLRLVADHVSVDTQEFHRTQPGAGAWKTGHRLLVAVSPSPLSEPLIRWARRMADSLQCPWLAVHVENSRPLDDAAQSRLEKNLALARTLGAEVIDTTDENLAAGLLRIARQHNVSQIIVGKPAVNNLFAWFRAGKLLHQLARDSGDIDLQIVRAEKGDSPAQKRRQTWRPQTNWKQYALVAAVLAVVGWLNYLLMPFTGPRVPGFVFLLVVVVLALFLGRGPMLFAGTASALVWDYYFLPPRFTFIISTAEDGILFALYFIVAIVLGQLVARIRAQELAERRREERAMALYHLTRELAQAGTRDEVVWQLVAEVDRVFHASTAVVLPGKKSLAAHPDSSLVLTEKELHVAEWSFLNRQPAGKFTDNLPGSEAMHLPLVTERSVVGVLSVTLPEKTLTLARRDLLETYARQAALVLDRVALRAAGEQSKLVAESERLSNALLNSISHELRTPLAAITSATGALAESQNAASGFDRNMVAEIQEATGRLNRLVGNLLDVTRLDSGHVRPKLDWTDVGDLIGTTLRSLQRELAGRDVKVQVAEKMPLARLDFTLMQQALSNLLLNVVIHTPAGVPILVSARHENGRLFLSVADSGHGLPPELLPRIFDKFFRAPSAPAGGSGLGLAIVKGFVEAHGGQISAANRPGGGAIFTIDIPQPDKPPAEISS